MAKRVCRGYRKLDILYIAVSSQHCQMTLPFVIEMATSGLERKPKRATSSVPTIMRNGWDFD